MNIDVTKIIAAMLTPVTDFLKQQGIWDTLVKIYQIVSGIVLNLWGWLENNIGTQKILDLLVTFLKFILNIFLTLFDVLSKLVNWLLHIV